MRASYDLLFANIVHQVKKKLELIKTNLPSKHQSIIKMLKNKAKGATRNNTAEVLNFIEGCTREMSFQKDHIDKVFTRNRFLANWKYVEGRKKSKGKAMWEHMMQN